MGSDASIVLHRWRALADEWREAAARTCTAPAEGSSKRSSESSRKFGKPAPPRPVEPEADAPLLNLTVGGTALNVTFNLTQDDVAAAIATAYLRRLRNRTEVLESVDARLDARRHRHRSLASPPRSRRVARETRVATFE